MDLDRFIVAFDKGLRTLFAPAQTLRPVPGDALPDVVLSDPERRDVASLMRVNHSGEICAQALYQGQALTARNTQARAALEQAAREETEHLAWTERRIEELGGRKSVLNPFWYAGAFGIARGICGEICMPLAITRSPPPRATKPRYRSTCAGVRESGEPTTSSAAISAAGCVESETLNGRTS